jgi:hypothetical protein
MPGRAKGREAEEAVKRAMRDNSDAIEKMWLG